MAGANPAQGAWNALPVNIQIWDGNASTEVDRWVRSMRTLLFSMSGENGYSLGQAANGTCPGQVNWGIAAPNAATMQQTVSRCNRASNVICSKIEPSTPAYRKYTLPPFCDDPVLLLLDLINVYLIPLTNEQTKNLKKAVEDFTMADVSMAKHQGKTVLVYSMQLQELNDKLPVALQKGNNDLCHIFLMGLHKKLFPLASAEDSAPTIVFPANIPVGYPNAGNAHPSAGQQNIERLQNWAHAHFTQYVSRGIIRLPSATQVNVVEYANYQQRFDGQRQFDPCKAPFVRCIRCGGLGHFASFCATPRNCIPADIISKISHVGIEVRAFVPRKGKGKGRGSGNGKGRGRGRGVVRPDGSYGQVNAAEADVDDYADYVPDPEEVYAEEDAEYEGEEEVEEGAIVDINVATTTTQPTQTWTFPKWNNIFE